MDRCFVTEQLLCQVQCRLSYLDYLFELTLGAKLVLLEQDVYLLESVDETLHILIALEDIPRECVRSVDPHLGLLEIAVLAPLRSHELKHECHLSLLHVRARHLHREFLELLRSLETAELLHLLQLNANCFLSVIVLRH